MQVLGGEIIRIAQRKKMINLEAELKEFIGSCQEGEMIICPLCKYHDKRGKGTAKVYPNKTFKCFSCGAWRRLEW